MLIEFGFWGGSLEYTGTQKPSFDFCPLYARDVAALPPEAQSTLATELNSAVTN
jgi:hypothetical protein